MLVLAVLGLLVIGAAHAFAQVVSTTPAYVTDTSDQAVITPVRARVYYGGPAWGGRYWYGPGYAYRPLYPRGYYAYPGYVAPPAYVYPSPGYYTTPGFYYGGPRVRFGIGF
jgi:hypothetical protein